MRRTALVAIVLLCGFAVVHRALPPPAPARAVPAQTVTYQAGWNLVSGPDGSTLSGATGYLYTLQPGDSNYVVLPVTAPLRGCWGYWAYFPAGGSLMASEDTTTRCDVPTLPGQWVMIGNPSPSQTLSFSGIDFAYTYDPAGGYSDVQTLAPGQGAFASGQRELVLGPAAPATPSEIPPITAPQPMPALATPAPAARAGD
jgi:hypothetical protein